MKARFTLPVLLVLGFALAACSRNLPTATNASTTAASDRIAASEHARRSDATVFTGAGDITPSVNAFRNALGTLNANLPGSRDSGRREINWDAVPAANTDTNDFPVDFFNQPNPGRARGAVFSTPGTGFRVSDNNFTDLNPEFANEFQFFSPIRTFAPVGSNRMTQTFFVPGSNVPAISTGFGVVFSDVDREGSATIRLLDVNGRSLGEYTAPVAPGGLSFLGVVFPTARVASVEIKSGQAPVAAGAVDVGNHRHGDGDGDDDDRAGSPQGLAATDHDDDGHHVRPRDLVIMDDFIYGEPIAAPGTQTAIHSGAGMDTTRVAGSIAR